MFYKVLSLSLLLLELVDELIPLLTTQQLTNLSTSYLQPPYVDCSLSDRQLETEDVKLMETMSECRCTQGTDDEPGKKKMITVHLLA